MRVTTKGQVTIPRRVREILGIAPETDIDCKKFVKLRGIATAKMSTDEIMNFTRK